MRAAIALLGVLCFSHAEIIDRIAVAVDNSVITASEILRQIRVTAFLNDEKPDFSSENKRDTADRLVEQMLIRREIQLTRFSIDARGDSRYEELRKRFPSEQAYREKLAAYNLTDADVRAALDWQATFLEFVVVRFRPGVQIPEEEIRDYYERQVKPLAALQPEAQTSYEEAHPQIESVLTSQRVDNALDRWLGSARTQTRIRYMQEVFR
jgi:hypothetical protein